MSTMITGRHAGTRRTRPAIDPARLAAELDATIARIAAHRRKRSQRAAQGLRVISSTANTTWRLQ